MAKKRNLLEHKRKNKPRIDDQRKLRQFTARCIGELYIGEMDHKTFELLVEGCKQLKEIISVADLEKRITELENKG